MVALLVSLDAAAGLAELTGWYGAVPLGASALPGAIEESHGRLQDDFALFRQSPFEPGDRLARFHEALTIAVDETDFGVWKLRQRIPWRGDGPPPDNDAIWNGSDWWRIAAVELVEVCMPDE